MDYQKDAEEPTLAGFLEETALIAEVDRYDESADAVVLMTIHSAKGLEFPTVFLPGMEEGIFPGNQSIEGGNAELEEERRLAYVAITRAKRELYILRTAQRLLYGRTSFNPVSRFVSEIPESLLEKETRPRDGGYYGSIYGQGAQSGGYGYGSRGAAPSPEKPRTYLSDRYPTQPTGAVQKKAPPQDLRAGLCSGRPCAAYGVRNGRDSLGQADGNRYPLRNHLRSRRHQKADGILRKAEKGINGNPRKEKSRVFEKMRLFSLTAFQPYPPVRGWRALRGKSGGARGRGKRRGALARAPRGKSRLRGCWSSPKK